MLYIERIQDPVTDSNCYLAEEQGYVAVIDPNCFEKIEKILDERLWTPEMIFLTHEHCDHMAGLEAMRNKYRIPVISSLACSQGTGNKRDNMSRMMEIYLYYKSGEKEWRPYEPFVCRPSEIVFQEEKEIKWREHRFFLKRLPGHTKGSTVIFLDGNILFSGDYLIPGEEVITRLPGGNEEEYQTYASPFLEKLQEGLTVMPGHKEPYKLSRGENK